MTDTLLIIVYSLIAILLVVLIIFVIRLFSTLSRLNKTLDDVNTKIEKLNGLFNIIDNTTDYISVVSDKFIDRITGLIDNWFSRKKKEGENNDILNIKEIQGKADNK